MNSVKTAITSKATSASDFNTVIGGRFYYKFAPQEPTYPFVIYSFPVPVVHEVTMAANDREETEEYTVQFNIYSKNNSSTEAGTTYNNLIALFTDDVSLSITGYTFLSMVREFTTFDIWDDEYQHYVIVIQYNLTIQKN